MTISQHPVGTHDDGIVPCHYWAVNHDEIELAGEGVIEESTLAIYVNGRELATLMCSPVDQEALALGFLLHESVIAAREDVRLIKFNSAKTQVDIFLHRADFDPPRRIVLTSGCSGGVTFQDVLAARPPLNSTFATTPHALTERMGDLHRAAQLFAQVRGVHTAILATPERLLLSAEDIGRHNTLDKIAGKALQAGIDTTGHMLLTTGRISSEMLNKARMMRVPLVASRTSPTSATVTLAQAWDICVVGYLRGARMRVYAHPERLGLPALP